MDSHTLKSRLAAAQGCYPVTKQVIKRVTKRVTKRMTKRMIKRMIKRVINRVIAKGKGKMIHIPSHHLYFEE